MSRISLPEVSVLLPAYNYESFVQESLESALAQDYPADRLQIIVVDDGSTDGTADAVRRVMERHPGRVTFVQQENSGQVATVARARDEATGELLAFLDADDIWLPNKVSKLVAAYQSQPDVGLVFSDMATIDLSGTVVKRTLFDPGEPQLDPVWLYARVMRTNIIWGGSAMYRADLMAQARPETIEAWDWWLAVLATQKQVAGELRIAFVPEALALYRDHGENMLLGAGGGKLVALRRRQLAFQLWAFRNMDITALSGRHLIDIWGGAEWFAKTAREATGSNFLDLVSISEQERARARELREQADAAQARGDLQTEMRLRFRAIAWDPFEPDAFLRLQTATLQADAVARLPHPLEGARPFVVLADAEDLLADEGMLRAYVQAMANDDRVTLAIDATRLPPDQVAPRLQALMSRSGVDDRHDIDVLAVAGALDAPQRFRMTSGAHARFVSDAAAAAADGAHASAPSFTRAQLDALRSLADT
ncbi:MAG TPA: glycosyltransferase [Solirubrobacteraceae bacterium]|nr:glycosyltransferase [Solirubrobacteraceae bacterium]